MAKVFYSASTENDLLEAWLYVAEDSVSSVDRMLDQIETEAMQLLDQPLTGRNAGRNNHNSDGDFHE